MLLIVKVLVAALAISGVAVAGVVHLPLTQAIDVHKNHLGPDSKLPEQAMKGQQNAYDHLVENQNRWIAANHTADPDDLNETAG